MSLARKKKLNDHCQQMTFTEKTTKIPPKPHDTPNKTTHSLNYMSRNWATAGFFDATVSFDSIRTEDDAPKCTTNNTATQMKLIARRPTRQIDTGEFVYEDVETGDVFEEIRSNHVKHGPLHLYKVLEVYPNSKAVLVQSNFGKEKKKIAELLNEKSFKLILTDMAKKGERKVNFVSLKSIRDPLMEERAKYSGELGKAGLFDLFRHPPSEYQPSLQISHLEESRARSLVDLESKSSSGLSVQLARNTFGVGESNSVAEIRNPDSLPTQLAPVVTPRLAYIRACHREALPPIPLLAKCFDESYPVLDLTDQSVGSRYCVALAGSFPNMKFLKEVNLSGNRLDHRSACVIIDALRSSSIESIVLDNNKIGKQGVNALISLFTVPAADSSQPVSDHAVETVLGSRLPPLPIANVSTSLSSPLNRKSRINTTRVSSFSLVKLSVSDNEIGDTLVAKLIKCLYGCSSRLKYLGLRNNKCSLFTAKALSELLTQSPSTLEFLDVSWNNLQSKGGSLLIKALLHNEALQELKLDWNGIGEEVIPLLSSLIESSTSGLVYITLHHNHISDCILKEIETRCPLKRLHFNQDALGNVIGGN